MTDSNHDKKEKQNKWQSTSRARLKKMGWCRVEVKIPISKKGKLKNYVEKLQNDDE